MNTPEQNQNPNDPEQLAQHPEISQPPDNAAHESTKYPEDIRSSEHTEHALVENPENLQHSDYTEHEFAEHPEYSQITGTFREQANAAQAIEELKQLGFREDQIKLTEYDPTSTAQEGDDTPSYADDIRFFVHVQAEGKEQEVVGLLVKHGSNNSDLPRGLELVDGKLTHTGSDASAPVHGAADEPAPGGRSVADDLVQERYNRS